MTRLHKILAVAATLAIALPVAAAGQGSGFTIDDAAAKKGKTLYTNRGCAGCHQFGRKSGGPDLNGLASRRTKEWLTRWLKETTEMIATDSTAQAMVAEFQGVKMPQFKLTDAEIDALINYMAKEGSK